MNKNRVISIVVIIIIFFIVIFVIRGIASGYYHIRGVVILNRIFQERGGYSCDRLNNAKNDNTEVFRAINYAEKSLSRGMKSSQLFLLLGKAYCLVNDPNNALDRLEEHIKLRPDDPLGDLEMGFLYEQITINDDPSVSNLLDTFDEFKVDLLHDQTVTGAQGKAVQYWKSAGATVNNFLEAGDQVLRLSDYDYALSWYVRALWMQVDWAPTWIKIGQVYDEMGQVAQAVKAYQIARIYDPVISISPLAKAFQRKGDIPEAVDLLQFALDNYQNGGQRIDWWRLLGQIFRNQKRWDEAAAVYEEAINEYTDRVDLYISLGWIYYDRGDDVRKVRDIFEWAVELNKTGSSGYYAVAKLLTQEGQYNEAESWYLRAIARAPNNQRYIIERANNKVNSGEITQAVSILQEASEKFPGSPDIYYQLARLYQINEQLDEAISAIDKAIILEKGLDLRYTLLAAQIHEDAGKVDEAISIYTHILSRYPENKAAQEGLDRLTDD